MTWMRLTDFPEHRVAYLEGWLDRPDDPAPCEPWLVDAAINKLRQSLRP
jgi:hypothetical protein